MHYLGRLQRTQNFCFQIATALYYTAAKHLTITLRPVRTPATKKKLVCSNSEGWLAREKYFGQIRNHSYSFLCCPTPAIQ